MYVHYVAGIAAGTAPYKRFTQGTAFRTSHLHGGASFFGGIKDVGRYLERYSSGSQLLIVTRVMLSQMSRRDCPAKTGAVEKSRKLS